MSIEDDLNKIVKELEGRKCGDIAEQVKDLQIQIGKESNEALSPFRTGPQPNKMEREILAALEKASVILGTRGSEELRQQLQEDFFKEFKSFTKNNLTLIENILHDIHYLLDCHGSVGNLETRYLASLILMGFESYLDNIKDE